MKTKKYKLTKGNLAAIIVMAIVCVALIVGDVIAGQYRSIISTYLGCGEQLAADSTLVEAVSASGDELVRLVAEDGIVLLKNAERKNGKKTLPLPENTRKLNLFGYGAYNWLLTGNGSGAAMIEQSMRTGLTAALTDGGFEYNTEIADVYKALGYKPDWGIPASNSSTTVLHEPDPQKSFSAEFMQKAAKYSDTAVFVMSRYEGEYLRFTGEQAKDYGLGTDTTRTMSEISTEEEKLLEMMTDTFDTVIVMFNTGSMPDMTFLEYDKFRDKIGAVLNCGYTGQSGTRAIPRILSGAVSPSGKLASTVVLNPKENEIAYNGIYSKSEYDSRSAFVYSEDIYLGYKWYETADVEEFFKDKKYGAHRLRRGSSIPVRLRLELYRI